MDRLKAEPGADPIPGPDTGLPASEADDESGPPGSDGASGRPTAPDPEDQLADPGVGERESPDKGDA